MFNTERLEKLKNNALIVRNELENSIINSTVHAETTIAQAIAIFTVCDAIVSNVHEYLTESEEYGDKNLVLFLSGMYRLLMSIRTDEMGYDKFVLECCANKAIKKHYAEIIWTLRTRMYYK